MFSFEEIPDSRSSRRNPPEVTLRYLALGEQDEFIVRNSLNFLTYPSVSFDGNLLFRGDIDMQADGWRRYRVSVPYTERTADIGQTQMSFDTTGGIAHIRAGKEHSGSYPSGAPTNPFHSLINARPDGQVEGCDIIVPALKLSYRHTYAAGIVNESSARTLANATGMTNANPFRTFQAGELLLAGATSSDGTNARVDVEFTLIASANKGGMTIGEITGIVKGGHEYAWIEYRDSISGTNPVQVPSRVHVEVVYEQIDFAGLFGWS